MSDIFSNYFAYYNPTVTFFNKLNVVNYKKCGTRFLINVAKSHSSQFDLFFKVNQPPTELQHNLKIDGINFDVSTPNLDLFNYQLSLQNIKSLSSLFLDNSENKLVYIIRNPFLRFISGLTQNLRNFFYEETLSLADKNYLNYNGFSSNDIDNFIKYFDGDLNNLHTIDTSLLKTFVYFYVQKYFYYLIDDIHTENYLSFVRRLIVNSKSENLDIIDIDDCEKYHLFDYIKSNTNDVNNMVWSDIEGEVASNKHIYDIIYDVVYSFSFTNEYLRSEVYSYYLLKKSKYYKEIK